MLPPLHRVARRARALAAATGAALLALTLTAAVQAQTAPPLLRVTTIPEEAATEQIRKFGPLAAYLTQQLGMRVEFTPVTDYPAAVEALVHRRADLVWFGALTFVQASIRSGGQAIPIAQRVEDTRFQSVFIARTDANIRTLADLRGRQVSFGSPSSTSGHLMPRHFLAAAGLVPERDFARVAFSGAHDAAVAAVVAGRVDAAALDMTVWDRFVATGRVDTRAVDAFHRTPTFVNYTWAVHAELPAALRQRIQRALLALDPADPAQREILSLHRATRYVETQPEAYRGIEAAARAAGLLR
jgi:phosphonate transport system substrate-binding protein